MNTTTTTVRATAALASLLISTALLGAVVLGMTGSANDAAGTVATSTVAPRA